MLFVASGRELDVPRQHATIQAAIDDANDFDVVVVADGTYTRQGNRDIDFKGKAITVRSESGPERCIIDCEGGPEQLHRGFDFHNGEDDSSILEGFTITGGLAERGGAISCVGSSPWVRDCIIENNRTAIDPSVPHGGGSPGGRGGGVYCESSSMVLEGCVIRDNKTSAGYGVGFEWPFFHGGDGGDGGGIYCDEDSYPIIRRCVIESNRTGDGGEGADNDSDGFTGGDGGSGAGIYCHEAVISNCIIANNTAGDGAEPGHHSSPVLGGSGGGVWCVAADISNCTIAHNITGKRLSRDGRNNGEGGGIYCGASTTVTNCILTENAQDQIYGTGTVSYSSVAGGWEGTGNIDTEPLFVDLDNGDYRLLPSSPCVDEGTNEPVGGLTQNDIEGFVRVVDGDHDGQAVVDMGAHEALASGVPVVSAFPQEVVFMPLASDGGPLTGTLTIVNLWDGLAQWTITESESCTWLEMIPQSGILTGGQSHDITLLVNKAGMEAGFYRCGLQVSAGDAQAQPQHIEVVLAITLPGQLWVPYKYPTIQSAIDAATEFETVVVIPGTYYENIRFKGANIVLRSVYPDDWNVVRRTVIDGKGEWAVAFFRGTESPDCRLEGFTITGGWSPKSLAVLGSGIMGMGWTNFSHTDAVIRNCYVHGNDSSSVGWGIAGGGAIYGVNGLIENCVIANNIGGGLVYCYGAIRNCTIVDNVDGLYGCPGPIENCIIWGNILDDNYGETVARYSCIEQNISGVGNIHTDPLFADRENGDYHLKSEAGRWDPISLTWVYDDVTSPCIDAGSPGVGLGDEFAEESNVRINMGAYGGTAEASRTPAGWGILGDMNNDRSVGMEDFGIVAELFGVVGERQAPDLNRDGLVGLGDLAVLVAEWAGK